MEHDDRLAGAFVDVVELEPAAIEVAAGVVGQEAFQDLVQRRGRSVLEDHHSTPSIMQLSPLPIPRNATRSPGCKKARSSARAAVSGSETVPMFPR